MWWIAFGKGYRWRTVAPLSAVHYLIAHPRFEDLLGQWREVEAAKQYGAIRGKPEMRKSFGHAGFASSCKPVRLATLGAVFLKSFKEAIGIAVAVVGAYLLLNLVVVTVGLYECVVDPTNIADWQSKLFANYGNPLTMVGVSLLVFPRLALGL